MRAMHARLDRLEAVRGHTAEKLSPAHLRRDVRRVLALVQPGDDPDVVFADILRDLESGTRTDEGLAAIGGVNIEILRAVARVSVSV